MVSTIQHSEKGKTLVTVKIQYFIFENVEKWWIDRAHFITLR
jgi:hypothetical protein